MPLDMATAMTQYGYVSELAKTNPEIKATLDRAVREEWDSARFDRELQNTGWYRSLSERKRQVEVQRATDPASWNAAVQLKAHQVALMGQRLGLTGVGAHYWAETALANDWDEGTLQAFLVDAHGGRMVAGGFTGGLGEVENHIRRTWAQYGLDITDGFAHYLVKETAAGRQTLGGLDNEAKNYAKHAYPGFGEQLERGMTMQDIASPYIQTMANTLELSGNVSLKDPSIKRALQGENGQPMAMWQFERTLKDDARWQNTKQAKDETYAVLQQVGQDWGFL